MDSMLVWVLRDNPSRGFYEELGGRYLREQVLTIGGADLIVNFFQSAGASI